MLRARPVHPLARPLQQHPAHRDRQAHHQVQKTIADRMEIPLKVDAAPPPEAHQSGLAGVT